ncbi:hypothetical protein D9M69_470960 [compost metagenome]
MFHERRGIGCLRRLGGAVGDRLDVVGQVLGVGGVAGLQGHAVGGAGDGDDGFDLFAERRQVNAGAQVVGGALQQQRLAAAELHQHAEGLFGGVGEGVDAHAAPPPKPLKSSKAGRVWSGLSCGRPQVITTRWPVARWMLRTVAGLEAAAGWMYTGQPWVLVLCCAIAAFPW